jgi:hypothetical protein
MHTDPSPPPLPDEPGGSERAPDERWAAEIAQHVGDHHFEHPTVAPVSRPAPAATSQW